MSRKKSRLVCWSKKNAFRVPELEYPNNEIMVYKCGNTHVVGLYRPFKTFEGESLRSNYNWLLTNLNAISSQSLSLLCMGDFNINFDDFHCTYRSSLSDWADSFALDQLVSFPTRSRIVMGRVQSSMIDLVFSNIAGVLTTGHYEVCSDHVVVEVTIPVLSTNDKLRQHISYLDWREYSPAKMRDLYNQKFRGLDLGERNPEVLNEIITSTIFSCFNKLVPKRSAVVISKNPVVSAKIRNLKNKKSRLYKKWSRTKNQEDYDRLREVSNLMNREIKNERKLKLIEWHV